MPRMKKQSIGVRLKRHREHMQRYRNNLSLNSTSTFSEPLLHEEAFHNLELETILSGEVEIMMMDYASQVLKTQFETTQGLFPPSYLYAKLLAKEQLSPQQMIPTDANAVQIHFIQNHYVVSQQNQHQIIIWDSLPNVNRITQVWPQLNLIYECLCHQTPEQIKYVISQNQGSTIDCGIFAIFNAYLVLSGQTPNTLYLDQSKLRQSLLSCLQERTFVMPPLLPNPTKMSSLSSSYSNLQQYFYYQLHQQQKHIPQMQAISQHSAKSSPTALGLKKNNMKDKQRARETALRQMKRKNLDAKQKEKKRETAARQRKRKDVDVREIEKARDRLAHQMKRKQAVFKQKEKKRETTARQTKRMRGEVKDTERKIDRMARQAKRKQTVFKEREKERETTARQMKRMRGEVKDTERKRDRMARQAKRKQTVFKEREKERETRVRQTKRMRGEVKDTERKRDRMARQAKRKQTVFKEREKERETRVRQTKRMRGEVKDTERKRDRMARQAKRKQTVFKEREKERETRVRQTKRMRGEVKDTERKRDRMARQAKRKQTVFKEREKERETRVRQTKRMRGEVKDTERKRDRMARQAKRKQTVFKEREKERETRVRQTKRMRGEVKDTERKRDRMARQAKRKQTVFKEREKERETTVRQTKRMRGEVKDIERKIDRMARQAKRKQTLFKEREKERETTARKRKREQLQPNTIQMLIEQYHKMVESGPEYICTSCDQLLYKKSVVKCTSIKNKSSELFYECVMKKTTNVNEAWLCKNCQKYLKQNTMPPCSVENGLSFPDIPDALKDLHPLELRLISPRLPFMKIYHAPRGNQYKISGNIVNVPVNFNTTVNTLPRLHNDMATIKLKLKRRLRYQHAVMTQNIRPNKVRDAARWLTENGMLYKDQNISYDSSWKSLEDNSSQDIQLCVDTIRDISESVEPHDTSNSSEDKMGCSSADVEKTKKKSTEEKDVPRVESDEDAWSEVDDEEISGALDTMFTSPTFLEDDEQHMIHSIAPGEGCKPVSVFKDTYAEELSFPAIFCGNKRPSNSERRTPIHYSQICKSEARRADRRVAMCVDNLFFKTKKLQMKFLLGKASIAVRKHKLKGRRLTAKDVKSPDAVKNLLHHDDGYKILATLRGSPPYFSKVQKDIFAMIRQLGAANLFCSFSAAETRWSHLLKILGKILLQKDYTSENLEKMSWTEKCWLIQNDPVTCARHFEHQVKHFINDFLKSKLSPLGVITDYVYRVEFQQRGSPHIHMLLWTGGTVQYGMDPEADIAAYIDSIITCKKPTDTDNTLAELVTLQIHRHSHTCRKTKSKACRFGFPKPPMRSTKILTPLDDSISKQQRQLYENNFLKLQKQLHLLGEDTSTTFQTILDNLGVSEEDYLLSIRSSLKHPTVFLKRSPAETRVNPYNPHCLLAWRANHDIQFITDVYACAVYIASYVSKGQRGMSELLRKACEECRKGNTDIRQQVKTVGNKFLNNVELSAQEAVYILLQLPMRKSSRQVVFVNTSPPDERVLLLKSSEVLESLHDDSCDIECSNLLKRYANRPPYLEKISLAEYATSYDKCILRPTVQQESDHDNNSDTDHQDSSLPQSNAIKKRAVPRILRAVWFSKNGDREKHYREQLMLYTPWRHEEQDLIGGFQTYEERHTQLHENISLIRKQFQPYADDVDSALDQISADTMDTWDTLVPGTQQNEIQDQQEIVKQTSEFAIYDPTSQGVPAYDLSADLGLCLPVVEEINTYEMSDQEFRNSVRMLNEEQKTIFYDLLYSFKTTKKPVYKFISGGAGVGKSQLTRTLYQALAKYFNSQAGQDFEKIHILILAPTGKAAYNIHGQTIHSALKIPVNQSLEYRPLASNHLNTMRSQLECLKVLFIDEISMVGNRLFHFCHKRLQEVFGNSALFGGISVIAVGDLFQLPPVCDKFIFENLSKGYGPLAQNIWSEFTMYELTTIMRQKESKQLAELLNRLREGLHTKEDLNVLNHRQASTTSPLYPKHETHLFLSNKMVDQHNNMIFQATDTEKFTFHSEDVLVEPVSQQLTAKILSQIPDIPSKTMQLYSSLELAISLKYDLSMNVRVDDGLANGATCRLKKVTHATTKYNKDILWVHFEDESIGCKLRREFRNQFPAEISNGWTPIQKVSRQFQIGKRKSTEIMRTQFPLRPCSAKTIHRAQGDTMDTIVVDFSTNRSISHIHYVGLSRVTKLEGLYIINLNSQKIKVDNKVKEEMTRLREQGYTFCQRNISIIQNTSEKVVVLSFLNARSLHRHIQDIRADSRFHHFDISIFSETRFSPLDDENATEIPGFPYTYRNDGIPSQGRSPHGTAVYTKSEISEFNCFRKRRIEITVFNVLNLSLTVISVYKPPSVKVQLLLLTIKELMEEICLEENLLMLGDFNVQWSPKASNSLSKYLEGQLQLKQCILDPTTDQGNTLDHIYCSPTLAPHCCGTLETYFTDHKLVFVSLPDKNPQITELCSLSS